MGKKQEDGAAGSALAGSAGRAVDGLTTADDAAGAHAGGMDVGQAEEVVSQVYRTALSTVEERGMAGPDTPVLLMVSGGSDSTALAYVAHDMAAAGKVGPLAMLHVNHRLRGAASDGDAAFVRRLADALGIPLFMVEVDVARAAKASGKNLEAAGRDERYASARDALRSLCAHAGVPEAAGRAFTAHTADDRVEEFYMRSIVGTGPGGFRSMGYASGRVRRPLLDLGKERLRDYLRARAVLADAGAAWAAGPGVPPEPPVVVRDGAGALWREDATNADTERFRAYVRHELVPVAKARNPRLLDTLTRTMNLIADEDDMLAARAQRLVSLHVRWVRDDGGLDAAGAGEDHGHGCVIDPQMARCPRPMLRRVAMAVLERLCGPDARVESAAVEGVLAAFGERAPVSGYAANVQGDLAVSANKRGVRVEPMADYRARRKGVK